MVIISIHAPHEGERRYNQNESVAVGVGFQSTLPTRGSDVRSVLLRLKKESNFNPRSPRGGATFSR